MEGMVNAMEDMDLNPPVEDTVSNLDGSEDPTECEDKDKTVVETAQENEEETSGDESEDHESGGEEDCVGTRTHSKTKGSICILCTPKLDP